MSVLLVTSLGDIVIDLHTDRCPIATKNFLKLCKIKYYNHCLFHSVQKDFIAQTGDPTGKGTGGDSIYKFLYGEQARFFTDEIHQDLKHSKVGTVAMASAGENLNTSQFYITLREELDYLDGKHTVFGEVAEGFETLTRINESFVDDNGRPYKNIRIKHSYILDDPFDDPPQLVELIPELSPEQRPPEQGEEIRLEDDWVPMDEQINPEELEKSLRKKEAQSRAVVLEMIGDIPEAEIKPPENVLFVCKLNPVTQEEDLEVIFSRFGKVISADIIRDYKTGDSLCYAFIEFETQEACEAAYLKMDNVLIDDRRIHVDFSQSVAKLWNQYRRAGSKMGDAVQGRQNGCYKCGEVGHIARECSNDADQEKITASHQHPKYVLKDSNKQLGGSGKSYDMIFEVDCLEDDERKHHRHTSGHHGKDQVYARSQRQEKYDKLSKEQRSSMDRERKSSEMDNNNDSKRRQSSEISERGRYRYNDHRETYRSSEVDHEFRDRREQNYMKTYEQVTHERKRRLGNVEQQSKTNDRHSKRRDHDERERSRHERDHKKGRLEKEREDDRYGYKKSQCKESSSRRS